MEGARREGELLSLLGQSGDDGGVAVACSEDATTYSGDWEIVQERIARSAYRSTSLISLKRLRLAVFPFYSILHTALTLVNRRVSAQAINVLVSLSIGVTASALLCPAHSHLSASAEATP